jgi:hypothetical protein
MLLGSVDSALRVLMRAPGGHFVPACALRGHDNWIRGIAPLLWTPAGAADGGSSAAAFGGRVDRPGHEREELLVATASQDRAVRIWRIAPARQGACTGEVRSLTQPWHDECPLTRSQGR